MFDFLTREPIDEDALHSWAAQNGGIWHPAGEGHHGRWSASAKWGFESRERMEDTLTAKIMAVTDRRTKEWALLMHTPPQGRLNIELHEDLCEEGAACAALLSAMFQQWDGYAYDLGCHDWVSSLLAELLPSERIIRYEPPPRPLPPWIWVNSKYVKNEAYYDNLDANAACNEN